MVSRVQKFENLIFGICEEQSQPHGFSFKPHCKRCEQTALAQVPEGSIVQKYQPVNPSASLSPAADYMKFGTELMAGLCNYAARMSNVKFLVGCSNIIQI